MFFILNKMLAIKNIEAVKDIISLGVTIQHAQKLFEEKLKQGGAEVSSPAP